MRIIKLDTMNAPAVYGTNIVISSILLHVGYETGPGAVILCNRTGRGRTGEDE